MKSTDFVIAGQPRLAAIKHSRLSSSLVMSASCHEALEQLVAGVLTEAGRVLKACFPQLHLGRARPKYNELQEIPI
jgi:hypothetical protein